MLNRINRSSGKVHPNIQQARLEKQIEFVIIGLTKSAETRWCAGCGRILVPQSFTSPVDEIDQIKLNGLEITVSTQVVGQTSYSGSKVTNLTCNFIDWQKWAYHHIWGNLPFPGKFINVGVGGSITLFHIYFMISNSQHRRAQYPTIWIPLLYPRKLGFNRVTCKSLKLKKKIPSRSGKHSTLVGVY